MQQFGVQVGLHVNCTRGNKARMTLVCDRDQGCMGYRKKLNEEELAQRPVHSNLQN